MSAFLLGDRGIFGLRSTTVSKRGIGACMDRIPVVRIDDVTCSAATGTEIAGVVVGPKEGEVGIIQPSLVEIQ